ncbi:hypothetical protein ES319_A07G209800v1 [Gossypium barbadense]|uniref:Leucine-rich repeat-containing N-terminal plant-type domain-containing protein n=1 Tax=Gossypium barbadense TaxID=3634 RepID=A0A5J5V6C8_GOSBA|nr:hypothetical protein ES319_A07G209800v1 [Gossypium barbadense]
MGQLLQHFLLKCLLFLILSHFLTQCVSSMLRFCLDSERSALLRLKDSFILNQSASDDTLAYPKVSSWKLEGQVGGDCCSWDGVECDNNTGHVIGLDLSSSFLYGSINSNNSLFQLHHLRRLNLSDNNFNRSEIPSAIGNLTRLSRLDLSWSGFTGQIPYEVLQLSNLVILDLSRNPLELRNPSLKILSERLVNLKHLDLHKFPDFLLSQDEVELLDLRDNKIHGFIPKWIWGLSAQTLHVLDLSENFLRGFDQPIVVPQWINLRLLDLRSNMLQGPLPIPPASIYQYFVSNNLLKGEISSGICNCT